MFQICPAKHDTAILRAMIRELAEYEHKLDMAGYAVFFGYYSTWAGRGIFLEDLFASAAFRGCDLGKALLAALARTAIDEGCYGIHWEVLDWNRKATDLYKSLWAEFRDRWRPVLLTGKLLRRLADQSSYRHSDAGRLGEIGKQ